MPVVDRGISLRELTTIWLALGGTVEHVRRTGEQRFRHPDGSRSTAFNARKKDAPIKLVTFVRQYTKEHP